MATGDKKIYEKKINHEQCCWTVLIMNSVAGSWTVLMVGVAGSWTVLLAGYSRKY